MRSTADGFPGVYLPTELSASLFEGIHGWAGLRTAILATRASIAPTDRRTYEAAAWEASSSRRAKTPAAILSATV